MRPCTLATLLVCLVAPLAAYAAPAARVVEAGLYSAEPVADPPADTPRGRYRLLESTTRVPLRLGVRFGFCADFEGLDAEDKATMTELVRHPLMTLPSGIEATGWNVPRKMRVREGRGTWCAAFQFTRPHELVPGTWRFVVSDADGDLLSVQFEAVPAP